MAVSKEQAIADHLRNVHCSNMQSAASEAQWTTLFTEYFGNDSSDSDSNGSGTDTDRDLSRATYGGSSDSGGERNIVPCHSADLRCLYFRIATCLSTIHLTCTLSLTRFLQDNAHNRLQTSASIS